MIRYWKNNSTNWFRSDEIPVWSIQDFIQPLSTEQNISIRQILVHKAIGQGLSIWAKEKRT